MKGLQIETSQQEEYSRIHEFGEWAVAIVRDSEKYHLTPRGRMEKHPQTDQCFVLLRGSATLYIGPEMKAQPMETEYVYTIEHDTWYCFTTVPGTAILVVENADTTIENSVYWDDVKGKLE